MSHASSVMGDVSFHVSPTHGDALLMQLVIIMTKTVGLKRRVICSLETVHNSQFHSFAIDNVDVVVVAVVGASLCLEMSTGYYY